MRLPKHEALVLPGRPPSSFTLLRTLKVGCLRLKSACFANWLLVQVRRRLSCGWGRGLVMPKSLLGLKVGRMPMPTHLGIRLAGK